MKYIVAVKIFLFSSVAFLLSACVQTMQDTFKSSKSYALKYSHVSNQKMFMEELNEIIQYLPNKKTFANALNNLQELIDSKPDIKLPNRTITFICAFNKKQEAKLQDLLKTRRYPCDMDYAGYTLKPFTNTPYKEFYGSRFQNTQNKEQFILTYTKVFSHVTDIEGIKHAIQKIYDNMDSNKNAIYELRELKHYSFNQGIINSYNEFYGLLKGYNIKCSNSLFVTTLDKAVMQQDLACKSAKKVKASN